MIKIQDILEEILPNCEGYTILGEIKSELNDTDIVFINESALKIFRKKLWAILEGYDLNYKIEYFTYRLYREEVKYHIYCGDECIGQLDLWILVQSRGMIYYKYRSDSITQKNGLNFVKEVALVDYREAKKNRSIKNWSPFVFLRLVYARIGLKNAVLFYGVDGVGKTTQIDYLEEIIYNDVIVVHTRPKLIQMRSHRGIRNDISPSVARSELPLSLFKSFFYGLYWITNLLMFVVTLRKDKYVIFDRGPLELYVQEVYYNMPRFLKWFIVRAHGPNNTSFIFIGNADEVWNRKKELTLKRTKLHQKRYSDLCNTNTVRLIDASGNIENVKLCVRKIISNG